MAKLLLLTSDKKHVSILQNIEIDKELPKYRVMSEASNGATDEFDDIARAIKKGVDVSDELSTTLSYDVLKKYFLEKGDMEITSFNINVSDKMRRTIDKTRITANMTGEEKEAEAKRRRDPIMFGLISGSKKLYYICDWVTPDDDITLDKVIEILGKEIVESDFLKEKIESV